MAWFFPFLLFILRPFSCFCVFFPLVYFIAWWHHYSFILLPFDSSYDRIRLSGSPRFELSLLQSTPCKWSRPTILCTLNCTSGSKYWYSPHTVTVVYFIVVTFGLGAEYTTLLHCVSSNSLQPPYTSPPAVCCSVVLCRS